MPRSLFSPALVVARALCTHCRFEEALKWYALAFNPLSEDCSWCSLEQIVTIGDNVGSQVEVSVEAPITTAAGAVVEVEELVGSRLKQNRRIRSCAEEKGKCDSTKVQEEITCTRGQHGRKRS